MAGMPSFTDTAAATGPEALEPVVHAFAGALIELRSSKKVSADGRKPDVR
jgi:hypothetical protein